MAVVLGSALGAGAQDAAFVPDESQTDSMTLRGSTWSSVAHGYIMSIQQLTDSERTAYLEHVTHLALDPFLPPPTQEPRYLTFLLQLENRGDQAATFNPLDSWLVTNNRQVIYPLGLDDLGAAYRQMESELPQAYEAVRPALLERPSILEPGDSVAGLLIYRTCGPKTKRFRVDLQIVLAGGNVIKASAPYRRMKQ